MTCAWGQTHMEQRENPLQCTPSPQCNRDSVDSTIPGVDLWGNRFRISGLGKSGHWEQFQGSVPPMRL